MVTNLKLLSARRRNEQLKRGVSFLHSFAEATGLPAHQFTLLDPAYSIELEEKVYKYLQAGLRTGAIPRMIHLTLDEAIQRVRSIVSGPDDQSIDILLAGHPDFPLRGKLSHFLDALPRLIQFDQETITATTNGGQTGICLDVETESVGEHKYEIDVWGDWTGVGPSK